MDLQHNPGAPRTNVRSKVSFLANFLGYIAVTYSTCIFQNHAAKVISVPLQPSLNIKRRLLIAIPLLLYARASEGQQNATDPGDGTTSQTWP